MNGLADAISIDAAIAICKRHGYHVNKPRARVVVATSVGKLNAVGKPYSPQYDPNWKRKTPLTNIRRLTAPQDIGDGISADQWAYKCKCAAVDWQAFLEGKKDYVS